MVLYFSLQESSARQATIGKRKIGLKVIHASGGRLSLGQALLRSGVKFLPWQMAHTSVFQLAGSALFQADRATEKQVPAVKRGLAAL